jgi:hypothetical protein
MSSDLTNFIDIDRDWLESVGFEIEDDGEITERGWECTFDATSPQNNDGVFLLYSSSYPGSWELIHPRVNQVHSSIPLALSDDGNDVLKLAELLGIKLKA